MVKIRRNKYESFHVDSVKFCKFYVHLVVYINS
jgi:hypothetical protein